MTAEAAAQIRSYVVRIEHAEEEKSRSVEYIKDIFAEAKGYGLDTRILRKIITLRKKDKAAREEEEALIDLYMRAVESQMNLPLDGSVRLVGNGAEAT